MNLRFWVDFFITHICICCHFVIFRALLRSWAGIVRVLIAGLPFILLRFPTGLGFIFLRLLNFRLGLRNSVDAGNLVKYQSSIKTCTCIEQLENSVQNYFSIKKENAVFIYLVLQIKHLHIHFFRCEYWCAEFWSPVERNEWGKNTLL